MELQPATRCKCKPRYPKKISEVRAVVLAASEALVVALAEVVVTAPADPSVEALMVAVVLEASWVAAAVGWVLEPSASKAALAAWHQGEVED